MTELDWIEYKNSEVKHPYRQAIWINWFKTPDRSGPGAIAMGMVFDYLYSEYCQYLKGWKHGNGLDNFLEYDGFMVKRMSDIEVFTGLTYKMVYNAVKELKEARLIETDRKSSGANRRFRLPMIEIREMFGDALQDWHRLLHENLGYDFPEPTYSKYVRTE